jgi:hypothetical protein
MSQKHASESAPGGTGASGTCSEREETRERVVALLDLVLARAVSTDPDHTDTFFRNFARRHVSQCRELLSDTHYEGGAFVPDRAQDGDTEARL